MSVLNGAQRAPGSSRSRIMAATLAVVALVGLTTAINPAPSVDAATGPKVAIIVGPANWQTTANRSWANKAATEARRYTSNVVKVYSPNATWARVKAALTNASVVVYLGVGFGSPAPSRTSFNKKIQDGFALNPVAGRNNRDVKYYGEALIRQVALAPSALVILSKASYAAGSSPAGVAAPTLTVARKRVDNYAAGFLAAGASAVIADTLTQPAPYIRALFAGYLWTPCGGRSRRITAIGHRSSPLARVEPRVEPIHFIPARVSIARSLAGRRPQRRPYGKAPLGRVWQRQRPSRRAVGARP